jgi:hypothetical protein
LVSPNVTAAYERLTSAALRDDGIAAERVRENDRRIFANRILYEPRFLVENAPEEAGAKASEDDVEVFHDLIASAR